MRETSAQDSSPMPCCGSVEAPHSHVVVEVMFVATQLKHRKKKFFVQLLRLFMREVRYVTLHAHYHAIFANKPLCTLIKCAAFEQSPLMWVAEST